MSKDLSVMVTFEPTIIKGASNAKICNIPENKTIEVPEVGEGWKEDHSHWSKVNKGASYERG